MTATGTGTYPWSVPGGSRNSTIVFPGSSTSGDIETTASAYPNSDSCTPSSVVIHSTGDSRTNSATHASDPKSPELASPTAQSTSDATQKTSPKVSATAWSTYSNSEGATLPSTQNGSSQKPNSGHSSGKLSTTPATSSTIDPRVVGSGNYTYWPRSRLGDAN
jgi:hypothetical protein